MMIRSILFFHFGVPKRNLGTLFGTEKLTKYLLYVTFASKLPIYG